MGIMGIRSADYKERRCYVFVTEKPLFRTLTYRLDSEALIFLVDTPLGSWSMMVVQIEKPANMTLAAWFAELRSWFDENNRQLAFFASAGRVIDIFIFNVTFAENTQAHLFASKFTKYAPSIRRITSLEPCLSG